MMVMGSAKTISERNISIEANNLPPSVTGYMSPYPTVRTVTIHHQNVSGMLLNGVH